ncbi:hypothetical protein BCR34DRAFT_571847, partial [Clohesyomyces aquaticus]
MLRLMRNGVLHCAQITNDSRLGRSIDGFFTSLTSDITSFDMDSFKMFSTVVGLQPFQKRAPKDFEIFYLYMTWKSREGTPSDLRYQMGQIGAYIVTDLALNSNAVLMQRPYVRDFIKAIQEPISRTLKLLLQMQVVWSEKLTAPDTGSVLEEYWHIHPLFTLRLREYYANYADRGTQAPHGPDKSFRSSHAGFSQYYNKRAMDLDDANVQMYMESSEKMKFELDNIVNALFIWTTTEESSTTRSQILGRINQSFSLPTLPKLQYRAVIEALDHIIDHYHDTLTIPAGPSVHAMRRTLQLQNYLKAAEILQNMSLTNEDSCSMRHYNTIIEDALVANEAIVESNVWFKIQRAWTNMMKGQEASARHSYREARQIFEDNLAQEPPTDRSAIARAAYLKLRYMNLGGLLKCSAEDPDYPLSLLFREFERLRIAIQESTTAAEGLGAAHGWQVHNNYLKSQMDSWGGLLARLERSAREDETQVEKVELIGDMHSLVQKIRKSTPLRQSALKTMHSLIAEADVLKSPQALSTELLAGLTDAYGDQVDDAVLAKYLEELTTILIERGSNYEAALEVHARWIQLRRSSKGRVDNHILLVDEYVFAACFFGLEQFERAEAHCKKALELAEQTRTDKTWLICLRIAAALELKKGNYSAAVRIVCKEGQLAYAKDGSASYQKKGGIVRTLFIIVRFAMEWLEDEDIVPKGKQPIVIAAQDQLEHPVQPIEARRERKAPSQVFGELMGVATEILGPLKISAALARLHSSPTVFNDLDSGDEIAWAEIERELFADSTAPSV